ncbi:MAG: hypothetical protein ACYDHB_14495, partial [Candidatus Dormibacteria bacterium]
MPAEHDDREIAAGQAAGAADAIDAPGSESQPPPGLTGEQLTLELEQTKAAYQRLAADFENYKRRKAQEIQELARYG